MGREPGLDCLERRQAEPSRARQQAVTLFNKRLDSRRECSFGLQPGETPTAHHPRSITPGIPHVIGREDNRWPDEAQCFGAREKLPASACQM